MPAKPGVALIIWMILFTGCTLPRIGEPPSPGATPTPPSPSFRLTILHNNDGESQLVNLGSDLEDFGGVARFATVVQREKQIFSQGNSQESGVIMVSSGDNSLPGPEYTAGEQTGTFFDALALDLIGYDAIALGNHDFYFGPDALAEFIQQADNGTPFLSANLDFSDEPVLKALQNAGRLAESVVVEKNGAKIGIIGVTTPNLRFISSPRNVHIIQDIAREVQAEVALLEADGVNKIVLISHLQDLDADKALVGQVAGVDVVVAGGGNELLANEDDLLVPRAKEPDGPYPMMATDREGTRVPLVTTPGHYAYLGKLVVRFDGEGNLTEIDDEASGPIRIAGGDHRDAVQPDPQVQQMVVDPVVEFLKKLKLPIAISHVNLDGRRDEVRSRETNQGNLIADAIRWQARIRATKYGVTPPDVALQNGGGIRNQIVLPAGPIQLLDTFKMVPFSNLVAILENISREQFKEILENAVSRTVDGDAEGGSGRFAQVSGFSFEWSESGTAQVLDPDGKVSVTGTRVQKVILDDGTAIVDGGKVAPGPALTVTVIDFLARGGDEYPFRGVPFTNLGVTSQKALANYLQDPDALNGTITSADYPTGGEGRIKRRP